MQPIQTDGRTKSAFGPKFIGGFAIRTKKRTIGPGSSGGFIPGTGGGGGPTPGTPGFRGFLGLLFTVNGKS